MNQNIVINRVTTGKILSTKGPDYDGRNPERSTHAGNDQTPREPYQSYSLRLSEV
ncbi:MAG: hypothetical protein AAF546_00375 [Verrucomicrobiota bacterium]